MGRGCISWLQNDPSISFCTGQKLRVSQVLAGTSAQCLWGGDLEL